MKVVVAVAAVGVALALAPALVTATLLLLIAQQSAVSVFLLHSLPSIPPSLRPEASYHIYLTVPTSSNILSSSCIFAIWHQSRLNSIHASDASKTGGVETTFHILDWRGSYRSEPSKHVQLPTRKTSVP